MQMREVPMESSNIISLGITDGRTETWTFPDGTVVTMAVPSTEPPISVKHAVYCLSSIMHHLHKVVLA